MIVGVGIELVDTARFAAAIERFGDTIRTRLFTDRECAYVSNKGSANQSLAVRFAAKLAARRALRSSAWRWHEVEVVRQGLDAPTLVLHGQTQQVAMQIGVENIALTLSHDARWCVGQVIMESRSD